MRHSRHTSSSRAARPVQSGASGIAIVIAGREVFRLKFRWIVIAVLLGVAALGLVALGRLYAAQRLPVYASRRVLLEVWSGYKKNYLEPGTLRTLDRPAHNDATTARYEAATMLQAVWMDDKPTFDRSWQWVKDNLQDAASKRIASTFGKLSSSKSYGITNTAPDIDAETNIAFSLIQAYARWNETPYVYDSLPLIKALWQDQSELSVKPALYKEFGYVDESHPWNQVVDSSYATLLAAEPKLGSTTLPTLWQTALDWRWNRDPRAWQLLQRYRTVVSSSVGNQTDSETAAQRFGYFAVVDPSTADMIYTTNLTSRYSPDLQALSSPQGPTQDAWTWLGMAEQAGYFIDLTRAGR